MPVFKLQPACKDCLWGVDKLCSEYGVQRELHPLAEAWMLSCHPDGASLLPDGTALSKYLAQKTPPLVATP